MRRRVWRAVSMCCVPGIVLLATSILAATYHVSPHGSNTPPYDTYAKAATHPAPAVALATMPGDTVLVHAGEYTITVSTITLASGASLIGTGADSVRLLGTIVGDPRPMWVVRALGDNTVAGITITGVGANAIYMTVSNGFLETHDCVLEGLEIDAHSSGNVRVSDCEFRLIPGGGCSIPPGAVRFEVVGNQFIAAGGPAAGGARAIYIAGRDVVIRDNVFDFTRTDRRGLPIEVFEPSRFGTVQIHNNLFLGGLGGVRWYYGNGNVENNTFVGPNGPQSNGGIQIYQDTGLTLTVRNNAFIDQTHLPLFSNRGCTLCGLTGPIYYSFNTFWPPVDSFYQLLPETRYRVQIYPHDNVNAFPMFVPDSSFRLQYGSPLIDAGDPALLDADGSASDVGWTGGPMGLVYDYEDLAPLAPESLSVSADGNVVRLTWSLRPEADLHHYSLYRDVDSGFWVPGLPPYRTVATPDTTVAETLLAAGESYFYVVTAVDSVGLESGPSPEAEHMVTGVLDEPTGDLVPRTSEIRRVYPNPFNDGVLIEMNIGIGGDRSGSGTSVEIVNVLGQRVRVLGVLAGEGLGVAQWDGRTEAGTVAASGIYFAQLTQAGQRVGRVAKLVLLR